MFFKKKNEEGEDGWTNSNKNTSRQRKTLCKAFNWKSAFISPSILFCCFNLFFIFALNESFFQGSLMLMETH